MKQRMELIPEEGPRTGRRRTLAEIVFRKPPIAPVQPSAQEAAEWATSFGILLDSKYGKNLFKAFCSQEFSEENLEFYDAVEKFKNSSKRKLEKRAQKIIDQFILPEAPKLLNIVDQPIRTELMKTTEAAPTEIDRYAFDSLQNKVLAIMEAGSYRRFLSWSVYTELLIPKKTMD